MSALSDEFLEKKMAGMAFAQLVTNPDHPESLFVQAFLREALAAELAAKPESSAAAYRAHLFDVESRT